MFPSFPPKEPLLISLDLGLRFGWAFYSLQGSLIGYGSHHCAGREQLKKCAYSLIQTLPPSSEIWIEGGGALLKFWTKPALKKTLTIRICHAHEWRSDLFKMSAHLSGKEAKQKAIQWAHYLIELNRQKNKPPEFKGRRKKTKKSAPVIRHDTAEAILMGWWALFQRGWIEVGSFHEGLKHM